MLTASGRQDPEEMLVELWSAESCLNKRKGNSKSSNFTRKSQFPLDFSRSLKISQYLPRYHGVKSCRPKHFCHRDEENVLPQETRCPSDPGSARVPVTLTADPHHSAPSHSSTLVLATEQPVSVDPDPP